MSKRRHGLRSRRFARDQKYSIGFDHAHGVDTNVIGHWEDSVFHVDQVDHTYEAKITPEMMEEVRENLRRTSDNLFREIFGRIFDSGIIEGEYAVVETDPSRLLDAGEPES